VHAVVVACDVCVGLSVHGFIEALLSIARRRCSSSAEPLVDSFQRLVSSCHAALDEERRRVASVPRLTARRRTTASTLSGRRSAEITVSVSPRLLPQSLMARRPAPRSASSGALGSCGDQTDSLPRRIDYRRFSPDV